MITAMPTVLRPDEIDRLELEPLGTLDGVTHRVLWRNETSIAGVMTVAGGHRLGTHAHRQNHHHMWVLDGRAVIVGSDVVPGTYVHIPTGVDHDIDATGTEGCTLLYLYIRQD